MSGSFTVLVPQASLAPKAAAEGGDTNQQKISQQADLLSDQVPEPFKLKVRCMPSRSFKPKDYYVQQLLERYGLEASSVQREWPRVFLFSTQIHDFNARIRPAYSSISPTNVVRTN